MWYTLPSMADSFLKEVEQEDLRFYKISKFWIENKETLKRIGLGIFMAFDAILMTWVLWSLLDGFVISAPAESRAVSEVAAYNQRELHAYTLAHRAQSMDPSAATLISAGEGKYDFYATLENPNADWWAEVTYVFSWTGGESEPETTFILPGEAKPLVAFGAESTSPPRGVNTILTNVVWHRVDHHMTGEYASWAEDRLDFVVTDAVLGESELDGDIGRVSFHVRNATAYNYYEPSFIIVLKRGANVVGVNRTTLSDIDSGETQEVVVNWFGTVPTASQIDVIPEINIFDVEAYKPLEGETTTDTRTRVFPGRRR